MTANTTYIAFDPGGSTSRRSVGYAGFDERGEPTGLQGKLTFDELFDFLETLDKQPLKVIIYEGYTVSPYVRHGGQKILTIQAIGAIKAYAKRKGIKLEEQRNTVLPVAHKYAGIKQDNKKHLDDWVSAYLHGHYWLVTRNIAKPRLEKDKENA
jgi:hypothetical protein